MGKLFHLLAISSSMWYHLKASNRKFEIFTEDLHWTNNCAGCYSWICREKHTFHFRNLEKGKWIGWWGVGGVGNRSHNCDVLHFATLPCRCLFFFNFYTTVMTILFRTVWNAKIMSYSYIRLYLIQDTIKAIFLVWC